MKYLVIQSSDWSDEFTAECFQIYNSREEAVDTIAELCNEGGYFGTNEGWEKDELYEDDFKVKEISDAEAEVIARLLGSPFGTGLLK